MTNAVTYTQSTSCHTTALSGCNQLHQAYNPIGIHQMAPSEHTSINRPTTHLSTPKDERLSWPIVGWPVSDSLPT